MVYFRMGVYDGIGDVIVISAYMNAVNKHLIVILDDDNKMYSITKDIVYRITFEYIMSRHNIFLYMWGEMQSIYDIDHILSQVEDMYGMSIEEFSFGHIGYV